jgi:diguanylate cyclase (GGDEF)-like protein/PAS domain S-box-containing protein
LKQPDGSPAGKLVLMRKVTTGSLGLRQEEGTARIRANLLFEMVPSALLTINQRGLITYINPTALAVMGFSQEEVLGQPCHNFMDQECAESCWLHHPERAAPVRGLKCHLFTKTGAIRTILKNVELLRSVSGTVIGAIESFEDITEREILEKKLQSVEAERAAAFQLVHAMREISLEAVSIEEPAAVAEFLLELLDRFLPFEAAFILLVEPNTLKLQHQVYRGMEAARRTLDGSGLDDQWLFTRLATSTRPLVIPDVLREPEWKAAPGQEAIRSFAGAPILIRDELVGFIGCESQTAGFYRMEAVQDPLTSMAALAALALDHARRSGEQQYLALHDPLTGLANRAIFNYLLEHALQLARRQRTTLAIISLDLAGFKAVNEVFGRERGDQVLRSVAERLKECLRASDIIARLEGDEFVVALENIAREEDAHLVAGRLSKFLSEPHMIQGQEVVVQAITGVANYPRDGDYPDELLKAARLALVSRRD